MILAEKIYQKFINIKSKKLIKDFYIYFEEKKSFEINVKEGYISHKDSPCKVHETFKSKYYIVWPDDMVSSGNLSSFALSNFEDFYQHAMLTKIHTAHLPYIPSRSIYPLAMTYSKPLADLIDIPEYFMKVSDVITELQNNIKNLDIKTKIKITEGTRYIYSSKHIDENYIYSDFRLINKCDNNKIWDLNTTEIMPLSQVDEILTSIGDISAAISEKKEYKSKSKQEEHNILLTPIAFKKLVNHKIIQHLNSRNIIANRSRFKLSNFLNQDKIFKKFTLSYDPTMRYKPGTCKFNVFGVKPAKAYLIKDGKLLSPFFTDPYSYTIFNKKEPAPHYYSFSNLSFETLPTTSLNHLRKRGIQLTEIYNIHQSKNSGELYSDDFLTYEDGKLVCYKKNIDFNFDLIDLIEQEKVELVQFNNYEVGCVLKSVKL
jgi:hypothetical protein